LLQEKYQGKLTRAATRDIAKLQKGEHVDYLIGFVEFAGCCIDVSQKPLIPRPETEYWTQKAIEELRRLPKEDLGIRCLDIFAGSGCVGIAVLKHILQAHVDFAEQERKFLKQILVNLKKNHIPGKRFRVIRSDIFSEISLKYDYIFANPPYVAESRKRSVQPSVLKHEPSQALFAGKDGLKYIRRFLKGAKRHLLPGGKIYMEFDSPQKREIEKLLGQCSYSSWQFHKDQYRKYRFVVISS
jgi:HemK-like putative methylase